MSPTSIPTQPTPAPSAGHDDRAAAAPAARGACPECGGAVAFARPPLSGQVVSCAGCGAELEVTSREPLVLEPAPEVEEDWGE
jgi:alpha-aminoadipate carrier protein LysW